MVLFQPLQGQYSLNWRATELPKVPKNPQSFSLQYSSPLLSPRPFPPPTFSTWTIKKLEIDSPQVLQLESFLVFTPPPICAKGLLVSIPWVFYNFIKVIVFTLSNCKKTYNLIDSLLSFYRQALIIGSPLIFLGYNPYHSCKCSSKHYIKPPPIIITLL